ncbi:MAG TPA: hypothetical protein VNK52_07390 [Hyphomicrobiaceae bacterium]|nr:hypothetical protein [Hyphomicrobiaceae bacterium]
MPQLLLLGLMGAGLYLGYRWLAREWERSLAADRERFRQSSRGPRDLGPLEWDEDARVYRPAKR